MTKSAPQLRSLLYVPATKPEWVSKAISSGADALLLDLEDAVAIDLKDAAARTCGATLTREGEKGVFMVRINPVGGERWLDDLEAVVRPGLFGLVLPKCESPGQVVAVDLVVSQLERRTGMEPGSVRLTPMFESGLGLSRADQILASSPRVAYCWAGHTLDGDLGRDLRWGWTPEGTESLYARSKVVVDARAAGVDYPTTGVWSDIRDLDGLRRLAEQNVLLGYTGMQVIHPSHVAVVNRAFTASPTEVMRLEAVVLAMNRAESNGQGAVVLDGAMIDEAMTGHARRRLLEVAELGVEVSPEVLLILNDKR